MARLLPATCPKCGASVRIDPGKQFVTCGYCGTSSFVQTPERRATEEMRQAAHPIIQIERTRRRSRGCLPSLLTLLLLAALLSSLGGAARLPNLLQQALTLASGSGLLPALPSAFVPGVLVEEDLFENPDVVKARLEARLSKPVMLRELVLYPSYAVAEAQDPNNKLHLDRYAYRAGRFADGEPIQLTRSEHLDRVLFSLDEIDFSKLPGLIAGAPAELGLEAGSVSHVSMERDFSGKIPVLRIYASSPRSSGGFVEYDGSGKRRRVVH